MSHTLYKLKCTLTSCKINSLYLVLMKDSDILPLHVTHVDSFSGSLCSVTAFRGNRSRLLWFKLPELWDSQSILSLSLCLPLCFSLLARPPNTVMEVIRGQELRLEKGQSGRSCSHYYCNTAAHLSLSISAGSIQLSHITRHPPTWDRTANVSQHTETTTLMPHSHGIRQTVGGRQQTVGDTSWMAQKKQTVWWNARMAKRNTHDDVLLRWRSTVYKEWNKIH